MVAVIDRAENPGRGGELRGDVGDDAARGSALLKGDEVRERLEGRAGRPHGERAIHLAIHGCEKVFRADHGEKFRAAIVDDDRRAVSDLAMAQEA